MVYGCFLLLHKPLCGRFVLWQAASIDLVHDFVELVTLEVCLAFRNHNRSSDTHAYAAFSLDRSRVIQFGSYFDGGVGVALFEKFVKLVLNVIDFVNKVGVIEHVRSFFTFIADVNPSLCR